MSAFERWVGREQWSRVESRAVLSYDENGCFALLLRERWMIVTVEECRKEGGARR